jgi:hypothetical protein
MTTNTTLLGLGGLVLAAVSAFGFANAKSERADCPGKITCPLTGEVICRDQCPNVDPDRADCPGRIECPLTGELICVDQCPAAKTEAGKGEDVPACCQKK